MTKRNRDTSQKRNRIFDAAIVTFQSLGYASSSMDRIAEASQSSKRTVYNHFSSKEELLVAIIERFLDQKKSFIQRPVYHKDSALDIQLLAFIDAECFAINTPERLSVTKLITSTLLYHKEIAQFIYSNKCTREQEFRAWLEFAKKNKQLNIPKFEPVISLFFALIEGLIIWPSLFSESLSEKDLKHKKEEIVKTFLARYQSA